MLLLLVNLMLMGVRCAEYGIAEILRCYPREAPWCNLCAERDRERKEKDSKGVGVNVLRFCRDLAE